MSRAVAWPVLTAESGIDHYFKEIQRFPMLERQEEYMLAKRWREAGDRDAAHRLVISHLRLVAKFARGYRGYGLPIADLISEGHVGLLQAVERFEPEKGFRFSTYAVWWIKAAIQEYIIRSWSLVKMGTTASHRKLFFNLSKAKSRISALDEGDMRPDQVKLLAKRLCVTERAVIDMNRWLGGDASLNDPIRGAAIPRNGRTGSLVIRRAKRQRSRPARNSIIAATRCPLCSARSTRASGASSRAGAWPKTRSHLLSWPMNLVCRASVYAKSRPAPSKRCRRQSRTVSPQSKRRHTSHCVKAYP
jgi:alternative sigma factor RpoH